MSMIFLLFKKKRSNDCLPDHHMVCTPCNRHKYTIITTAPPSHTHTHTLPPPALVSAEQCEAERTQIRAKR